MLPLGMGDRSTPRPTLGWREWVSLPDLDIVDVKAKVDTGARSSALHAIHVELFTREGLDWVRFQVPSEQGDPETTVTAEAALLDRRNIRSSNGQVQLRPVIQTRVSLGPHTWDIELSLTNRDDMGFRMLLGRQAVRHRFLIDAGQSYLQSSKRQSRRQAQPSSQPSPYPPPSEEVSSP